MVIIHHQTSSSLLPHQLTLAVLKLSFPFPLVVGGAPLFFPLFNRNGRTRLGFHPGSLTNDLPHVRPRIGPIRLHTNHDSLGRLIANYTYRIPV